MNDLINFRFGKLTVIEYAGSGKWRCKCDCGCTRLATTKELKKGEKKSCGFSPCNRKQNAFRKRKYYTEIYADAAVILVDNDDFEEVKDFFWWVNGGYAKAFISGKQVFMHRFIMGAPKTMVVDHVNHNTLDNRRKNLRICTSAQNSYNKTPTDNETNVFGVKYNSTLGKYEVTIGFNGKTILIGYFTDVSDAISARKDAERRYFGEFAYKHKEE